MTIQCWFECKYHIAYITYMLALHTCRPYIHVDPTYMLALHPCWPYIHVAMSQEDKGVGVVFINPRLCIVTMVGLTAQLLLDPWYPMNAKSHAVNKCTL